MLPITSYYRVFIRYIYDIKLQSVYNYIKLQSVYNISIYITYYIHNIFTI